MYRLLPHRRHPIENVGGYSRGVLDKRLQRAVLRLRVLGDEGGKPVRQVAARPSQQRSGESGYRRADADSEIGFGADRANEEFEGLLPFPGRLPVLEEQPARSAAETRQAGARRAAPAFDRQGSLESPCDPLAAYRGFGEYPLGDRIRGPTPFWSSSHDKEDTPGPGKVRLSSEKKIGERYQPATPS